MDQIFFENEVLSKKMINLGSNKLELCNRMKY